MQAFTREIEPAEAGLRLDHVREAKLILDDMDLSDQRKRALHLVADGVVERYA